MGVGNTKVGNYDATTGKISVTPNDVLLSGDTLSSFATSVGCTGNGCSAVGCVGAGRPGKSFEVRVGEGAWIAYGDAYKRATQDSANRIAAAMAATNIR